MTKILVLGLGKSGMAAAEWLLNEGSEILAFDDQSALKERADVQRLCQLGVRLIDDPLSIAWQDVLFMVVSPGIPSTHPLYQNAVAHGVEIVGEADLALRSFSQRAVAITGTNGKTTVTLLVEHILKSAGLRTRSLGNVGEPLSAYAMHSDPDDILVVELSSYQIETLKARVFDAAVILNITPDHLDRYPDMQAYARAKCAIEKSVKEKGSLFIHHSVSEQYGYLLSEPYTVYTDQAEKMRSFPEKWGAHDRDNALAAWSLCRIYGISEEHFLSALKTFKKPHHRIEFVCEINGVFYYDDSKGTNVDAVIHAVRAMARPVVLIAGGVDKGASYLPWAEQLQGVIKCILVLGQAAGKIQQELEPFFEMIRVDSLEMAVEMASSKAVAGDAVLLSPGCSSFDMFQNYEERGRAFQRCVHQLLLKESS